MMLISLYLRIDEQNYGVSFPMMAKSDVNGSNTNEVFQFLKKQKAGILGTEMISKLSSLRPLRPLQGLLVTRIRC